VQVPRTGSTARGMVATKTLLFAGEGDGGWPMFRAHDKKTGNMSGDEAAGRG
jgi:quinoprotein glucose dehydrogenase